MTRYMNYNEIEKLKKYMYFRKTKIEIFSQYSPQSWRRVNIHTHSYLAPAPDTAKGYPNTPLGCPVFAPDMAEGYLSPTGFIVLRLDTPPQRELMN